MANLVNKIYIKNVENLSISEETPAKSNEEQKKIPHKAWYSRLLFRLIEFVWNFINRN